MLCVCVWQQCDMLERVGNSPLAAGRAEWASAAAKHQTPRLSPDARTAALRDTHTDVSTSTHTHTHTHTRTHTHTHTHAHTHAHSHIALSCVIARSTPSGKLL